MALAKEEKGGMGRGEGGCDPKRTMEVRGARAQRNRRASAAVAERFRQRSEAAAIRSKD